MTNSPHFSLKWILVPLLLFLFFLPFSSYLDLKISHFFFDGRNFENNRFWDFIFNYGILPAWVLVFLAFLGLLLSFFKKKRLFFRPCVYLLLTFALGAGLIIHAGLKEQWGRPRPRQTVEFGGTQPFRAFYNPQFSKQPEPSKSFSCGHCSLGFYFFSLAFLGIYYRSKKIYWTGILLAWILGILLSITRIAQGGHFFSDTLTSALIMWIVAYVMSVLLLKNFIQETGEK